MHTRSTVPGSVHIQPRGRCFAPHSRPILQRKVLFMAKSRGDFTELLVKKGILSADQLEEARGVAQQTGAKIAAALVQLGYATNEQVMQCVAEFNGIQFIDLTDVTIPPAVV